MCADFSSAYSGSSAKLERWNMFSILGRKSHVDHSISNPEPLFWAMWWEHIIFSNSHELCRVSSVFSTFPRMKCLVLHHWEPIMWKRIVIIPQIRIPQQKMVENAGEIISKLVSTSRYYHSFYEYFGDDSIPKSLFQKWSMPYKMEKPSRFIRILKKQKQGSRFTFTLEMWMPIPFLCKK